MVRKPRCCPSFFKVLMHDFSLKLKIPPAFVKSVGCNLLSKTCLLRSVKSKSWRVRVKEEDKGWFLKQGWPKFVADHCLEYGDFLIFKLVDYRKFQVVIYDKTCCEKDQSSIQIHAGVLRDVGGGRKKIKKSEKEMVDEAIASVKSKHPCFGLVFKTYKRFCIVVPRGFAIETGLAEKKSTAVTKEPGGRVWPVNIVKWKTKQVSLSSGWSHFCEENDLAEGDICVFQFIHGLGNVIHVKILKKGGRV